MSKNIIIIDGHPDPDKQRLVHAIADTYLRGAQARGNTAEIIRVAEMNFPLLRTETEFKSEDPPPEILVAQKKIRAADHIVIIYPLWLGTMPAMLNGFLEQIFRPGFGFSYESEAWPKKLLKGRSARIIVTMGMAAIAYRWFYWAHSLKSLERNILKFVGIGPIRETLFGMVDQVSPDKRAQWLSRVEELGASCR